jgi:hypothetical protein
VLLSSIFKEDKYCDSGPKSTKVKNRSKILNDITRAVLGGGDQTFVTQNPAFSYLVVYHLEILLLFFTLVLLGPLSQYLSSLKIEDKSTDRFGLSEMPI